MNEQDNRERFEGHALVGPFYFWVPVDRSPDGSLFIPGHPRYDGDAAAYMCRNNNSGNNEPNVEEWVGAEVEVETEQVEEDDPLLGGSSKRSREEDDEDDDDSSTKRFRWWDEFDDTDTDSCFDSDASSVAHENEDSDWEDEDREEEEEDVDGRSGKKPRH